MDLTLPEPSPRPPVSAGIETFGPTSTGENVSGNPTPSPIPQDSIEPYPQDNPENVFPLAHTKQPTNLNSTQELTGAEVAPRVPRSWGRVYPVTIRHYYKPFVEIRCLCIVDEQSVSSYMHSSVVETSGAPYTPYSYSVRSLGPPLYIHDGALITKMQLKGASQDQWFDLPPLLSVHSIPQAREDIATRSVVEHFPHIAHLAHHFPEYVEDLPTFLILGRDSNLTLTTQTYGDFCPQVHLGVLGWALVGSEHISQNSLPPNLHDFLPSLPSLKQPLLDNPYVQPANPVFQPTPPSQNCFVPQLSRHLESRIEPAFHDASSSQQFPASSGFPFQDAAAASYSSTMVHHDASTPPSNTCCDMKHYPEYHKKTTRGGVRHEANRRNKKRRNLEDSNKRATLEECSGAEGNSESCGNLFPQQPENTRSVRKVHFSFDHEDTSNSATLAAGSSSNPTRISNVPEKHVGDSDQTVEVVILGSSHVLNLGDHVCGPGKTNDHEPKSLIYQVGDTSVRVWFAGHSGASYRTYIDNPNLFNGDLLPRPQIVVALVGGNTITKRNSQDVCLQYCRRFYESLRDRLPPHVTIIASEIFMRYRYNCHRTPAPEIYRYYRDKINQRLGTLNSCWNQLLRLSGDHNLDDVRLTGGDGVHLLPAGLDRLWDKIQDSIQFALHHRTL